MGKTAPGTKAHDSKDEQRVCDSRRENGTTIQFGVVRGGEAASMRTYMRACGARGGCGYICTNGVGAEDPTATTTKTTTTRSDRHRGKDMDAQGGRENESTGAR